MKDLIYFDNAATLFPKSEEIMKTQFEASLKLGNAGRSSHSLSFKAAEALFNCREAISNHFNSELERTIFIPGATYGLNMAIKGICSSIIKTKKSPPLVACSALEHNSVYRPLIKLQNEGKIKLKIIEPFLEDKNSTIEAFKNAIAEGAELLVCTHASNVCGYVFPVEEIAKYSSKAGIPLIVDAAQSGGYIKIDFNNSKVDVFCLAAHKGIGAPFGLSAMLLGKNCPIPDTIIEGGSGSMSLSPEMPNELPDRLEAGSLNAPAASAFEKAVKSINYDWEESLYSFEIIKRGLQKLNNIKLYGLSSYSLPLILFSTENDEKTVELLDKENICVRSGFHCSPLAHNFLGSKNGGIRISLSKHNKIKEAEHFLDVIKRILN